MIGTCLTGNYRLQNKMSWDKERSGFCWRLPFRGFKKLANGRLSRAARVSVIRPTGHSIDWESGMPGSTGTAGSLGVSCGYSKPRELPPDGGAVTEGLPTASGDTAPQAGKK